LTNFPHPKENAIIERTSPLIILSDGTEYLYYQDKGKVRRRKTKPGSGNKPRGGGGRGTKRIRGEDDLEEMGMNGYEGNCKC
jgi:hypothetical protein